MIKENSKAPNFKLHSSNNKNFEIKKSLKQYLVIYFYPRDNTPGCTNEAKDFSKLYKELWREGTIENSKHIPRGMLEFWVDPESPYSKNDIPMDKNLILFCAQGMRSALATRSLKEMGFPKVSHVRGGFGALKDKGFKVVEVKKK